MEQTLNLSANLRALDTLKSGILSEVASLYQGLSDYDSADIYERVLSSVATIVAMDYILARRIGLDFDAVDRKISELTAITALERCAKVMYDSDLYDTTDYANILWGAGLMHMDMGEIHKAQKRIDTAWNTYSEVWKDEPELLEAKYAEFQSSALRTLFASSKASKLREFMDKNC